MQKESSLALEEDLACIGRVLCHRSPRLIGSKDAQLRTAILTQLELATARPRRTGMAAQQRADELAGVLPSDVSLGSKRTGGN
jgi:hypothetical protein